MEVESKETLLDVDVEIPEKFQNIFPGEEVLAKIEILNLGVFLIFFGLLIGIIIFVTLLMNNANN